MFLRKKKLNDIDLGISFQENPKTCYVNQKFRQQAYTKRKEKQLNKQKNERNKDSNHKNDKCNAY